MEFSILRQPVLFLDLTKISKELLFFYLTPLLFYEESSPEFIHFHKNQNDGEMSILLSEDACQQLSHLFDWENTRKYNCACILNTYEYIDDTGLVKQLSTAFGEKNIPILYITTLNNNFILFDNKHYDASMEILQSMTKLHVFFPMDHIV